MVILMTLEGERLLELHSSVSVASGMSAASVFVENQTAVSYIERRGVYDQSDEMKTIEGQYQ